MLSRRPIKLTLLKINESLACRTLYDAASPEIVKVTTDKLKIWLEECHNSILKQKCNFFNSTSNFIAVLGLLITLITTLAVTNFDSELWKAIYIVSATVISIFLLYLGYNCIKASKNRNPEKISDCIIKKIKEDSKIYVGEDAP
jgi:hypothetical protein